MTLIDATAQSVNTVYAQVVQKIGASKLDAMAEDLGISSSELPHPYLSQVLGTAEVSPLEMAAAYATFADGGTYHAPVLITKVTKADGTPLSLPVNPQSHQVLTPAQAAVEDYVLQQVVAHGTGTAAGGIGSQVAGKTGTTENSGDAWFIGFTPKLTTALWMGYAASDRSMDGFRGMSSVTGGTIPAELWHTYMAGAIQSEPQYAGSFPPPGNLGGQNLLAAGTQSTASTSVPDSSTSSSSSTSSTSVTSTSVPQQSPSTTAANEPSTTAPPHSTSTTTSTTTAASSTTSTTVASASASATSTTVGAAAASG
jgi:penicillin-binding protein 1A